MEKIEEKSMQDGEKKICVKVEEADLNQLKEKEKSLDEIRNNNYEYMGEYMNEISEFDQIKIEEHNHAQQLENPNFAYQTIGNYYAGLYYFHPNFGQLCPYSYDNPNMICFENTERQNEIYQQFNYEEELQPQNNHDQNENLADNPSLNLLQHQKTDLKVEEPANRMKLEENLENPHLHSSEKLDQRNDRKGETINFEAQKNKNLQKTKSSPPRYYCLTRDFELNKRISNKLQQLLFEKFQIYLDNLKVFTKPVVTDQMDLI